MLHAGDVGKFHPAMLSRLVDRDARNGEYRVGETAGRHGDNPRNAGKPPEHRRSAPRAEMKRDVGAAVAPASVGC